MWSGEGWNINASGKLSLRMLVSAFPPAFNEERERDEGGKGYSQECYTYSAANENFRKCYKVNQICFSAADNAS